MLAVVGLLWLAALPLTIEGASDCPQPDEVAARLQSLAPGRAASGRASLTNDGGRLRLRLQRPDGALVDERLFDAGYQCPELAEAAALVLASWLAELAPVDVEAPAPADTPAPPTTAPAAATATSVAAATGVPGWSAITGWQVGLGFLAAGPASPVAGVALSAAARRGPWTLALEASLTAFHQQPLGPGQVSWARRPLAITLQRRLAGWRDLHLDGGAGLAGALLMARGAGFDVDHQWQSFDGTPVAAVRLTSTTGPLAPFLAFTGAWWLRSPTLEVRPDASRLRLPRLDVWVVLGLAWRTGEIR